MHTIWMFTKWYPNHEDPQLGIFIRKHAEAIALHNIISVLYIHTNKESSSVYSIQENQTGKLHEVVVYISKHTGLFGIFIQPIRYLSALRMGIIRLRKTHPNPTIFHSYILLRTGIVAFLLSRFYRRPYVISEQWSGYATGRFKAFASWKKNIYSFLIRKADALMTVSHFLADQMQQNKLMNKNMFVIGNSVELPSIKIKTKSEKIRVLLVADLVDEIKNISGVIQMIASMDPTLLSTFELKIIGAGIDENKLKTQAAATSLLNSVIFFEGLKTNKEVYQYLEVSDFLLMNSRFETFSSVCVEALSCGIPVIATDCGGPSEFIRKECGLLIPVDDPSEFKKAFLYMLEHHDRYTPNVLQDYVKNQFSKEVIGAEFQTLYSAFSDS